MRDATLAAAIDDALAGRRLLEHPFYRRWEAGELRPGELAAYAEQYRHFEAALPGVLRELVSRLGEHPAAALVQRNLDDETGNPEAHVDLFETFADAVGAAPSAPRGPAVERLLDTYRTQTERGPATGLAAVMAYEIQAPAIAESKARGLRRHYGLDAAATTFWDVHATMDSDHADWGISALAELSEDQASVVAAVRDAADAWWAFLNEREAEAPPVAA